MDVHFSVKDVFYLGALAALGYFANKQNKRLNRVDEEFKFYLYPYIDNTFSSFAKELLTLRRDITDLKGDKK